jgi:hypothetical protein
MIVLHFVLLDARAQLVWLTSDCHVLVLLRHTGR